MSDYTRKKSEEQARRNVEQTSEQTKEHFERITSGASEATRAMRDCCAKTVKGAQNYNNRILEYAQANTDRSFELAQRLLEVKSPTEFFEVSSDHVRRQWQMIADQMRELSQLAQNVTLESAEPLKAGFDRMVKRAA